MLAKQAESSISPEEQERLRQELAVAEEHEKTKTAHYSALGRGFTSAAQGRGGVALFGRGGGRGPPRNGTV